MTTVRVLTPAGRGAIAVVEVVGPDAAALVDRWFEGRSPIADAPLDAVRFGRWRRPSGEGPGEELVVVRTAEDRIEVHCHGGVAASAAVTAALVGDGAIEATPQPPESLDEELRRALALAPTERVAGVLLDQANGSLEAAVRSIAAAIESGDDGLASEQIDDLLRRERLGLHLTTPWRVVIAGAPNVGKSSLINALVGYERAIVFDLPGTTRDVVTASTAIDGWPVTLADTAGVRATDDPLEAAGVELARRTLRTADIVVVVREAAAIGSAEAAAERERLLADTPSDAAVVDVASKADLTPPEASLPDAVVATSVPEGVGVAELIAAIGRAMNIDAPAPGAAVPLGHWRFDRLREARSALAAGDRESAAAATLSLLAGEKL